MEEQLVEAAWVPPGEEGQVVHHKPQVLSEQPTRVSQNSSEVEGKADHTPSKLPSEEPLGVALQPRVQIC